MGANHATRTARDARCFAALAGLLWLAAAAGADQLELHTGRVLDGTLLLKTDRIVRFRTTRAGGIVMDEVFSVHEVKRLQIDPPPAPATGPATRPASRPASRPATRPGPRIPTPWPDRTRPPPGLEPDDEEDPAERYERALRRALDMLERRNKRAAAVRLLTAVVTAAKSDQLARLSDICRDKTTRPLDELLAAERMKAAEQRGYGRKIRLTGVTDYEKNALLNLLGERITAARQVVAPFLRGTTLPPYARAEAVRTTARLLGEQLREWMRLQSDLSRADRTALFKEIRAVREVVIKAGKSVNRGPAQKK